MLGMNVHKGRVSGLSLATDLRFCSCVRFGIDIELWSVFGSKEVIGTQGLMYTACTLVYLCVIWSPLVCLMASLPLHLARNVNVSARERCAIGVLGVAHV